MSTDGPGLPSERRVYDPRTPAVSRVRETQLSLLPEVRREADSREAGALDLTTRTPRRPRALKETPLAQGLQLRVSVRALRRGDGDLPSDKEGEVISLFDVQTIPHTPTPAEEFEDFHRANLHIYVALRKLALDWVDAGHQHLGISMIWEVLRWQHGMRTSDPKFKLNNDLRAPYARLLAQNEPRLANVFETRRSHYDETVE